MKRDEKDGFHKLTTIKENLKSITEYKQPIQKDVQATVIEWVCKLLEDIDALWEIPISKTNTALNFNVSVKYIKNTLSISECSALRYREFTYPLIEKMIKEGILLTLNEGKEIAGIENRRKLLNWYRKLSIEEKCSLPIFGKRISLGRMVSGDCPLRKSDLRFKAVKDAWESIHQDLEKLGIIDINYKSVAERRSEKLVYQEESKENKKKRFNRLATVKLNIATDFIEPSELEPFIQIEQLFASKCNTVISESSKSNYRNACNLFIEFLSELHGTKPFKIIEIFDEHILSRYHRYLQDKIINEKISSHHANTTLSSVRTSLNRLTQIRDIEYNFFDVTGFDTNRTTNVKKPFTKNERLQIIEAIDKGIADSRLSLIPYKKTGIGKNPLDENSARIRGLSTLENARWLFENQLECKPVHHNTAETSIEKAFLQIIADSDYGLMEIYKKWGVTVMVTVDLLIPYLLRLAQITGMNADSLLSLDIEDYLDCHPATSRPCLRYWKERSDGHKEYHLDLFKADLTWLTTSQALSVKLIFEEVTQLTKSFRHNIKDHTLKNRLFIYQSVSAKKHGRVSPLLGNEGKNAKSLGNNLSKFVDKYNLKSDDGKPLILTISRFRPTFVSELLDSGVSLREIQLLLGHSSIQTTIKYLDSLDFNSISRVKLNDKLHEIHQSTLNEQTEKLSQKVKPKSDNKLILTFHTPLAECKNIFDPPEFVKKLSSYTPGTPCAQYNKCLSCDNVIITARNLPEIFALERDYTLLTEYTRVMDTPYGHVIRENLNLIKCITDPQLSDFSTVELEDGQRLAEYIETTILVDGAI
ncbi:MULTISPECIES: site-specific integrase [Acinetobacter calcoaceticus/baumannii complex]|uniref:site-specific integrase n=1 Tax=Acinetobacter calcoaceticus/baumannii complex TaxID=909768 RepID=UPI0009AAC754|nr:site-specific integrase [Acinetobacter baumannii]HCW3747475.1 site-specific integrase [Acinetobacter baumannii]